MRAPANAATGTSGQSYVKAKFEELGWGANSNFEHDLGTDLWLMARDERRFDLRELVGAQVKAGPSYFASPQRDESGAVLGWWYAESDDSHFEYWCDHSVPHLLVLHDLESTISYWVHVTRENLVSTGQGRKVLVPMDSTLDLEHFEELISVATSRSRTPRWEGTAWDGAPAIAAVDQIRYALVTPRLVAPHPNRGVVELEPHHAIALLVQMRLRNLRQTTAGDASGLVETARASEMWEWRLFAALYDWVIEGARAGLERLVAGTDESNFRVAAVVCLAVAFLEDGDPNHARRLLQGELDRDQASPPDRLWLMAQLAQVLEEQGDLVGARQAALDVQSTHGRHSSDPTASAFAAAAANVVFSLGGWDEPSLAGAIRSGDTAASWWRSQTLVSGLTRHFDDSFRWWVGDSSSTFSAEDEAWTKLRSAMLQSGYAADRTGWRSSGSRLARRQLMTATDDASLVAAFDLLRLTGDMKSLKVAVSRTLREGPTQALEQVGSQLDLRASTRTSLRTDLGFVEAAGDVLATTDCDRFVEWALEVLTDKSEVVDRLSPTFAVEKTVLDMLRRILDGASPEKRQMVTKHLVDLPAVTDQLTAQGYGRVLARIPDSEWSEKQLEALKGRSAEDNWELTDDIDSLLAVTSEEFRESLESRISSGDLRALHSYGRVTDLPSAVAQGAIEHLSSSVAEQIEQAGKGTYGIGGFDPLDALVLLNVWHPVVADWTHVYEILSLPSAHPDHIAGGIRRLGMLAAQVPADVAEVVRPHLAEIAEGARPHLPNPFAGFADARSESALALALLFPEEVADRDIRQWLSGDAGLRLAAVQILIARREQSQLNVLALLARDADVDVRAAAAEGLAAWVVQGVGVPQSREVLTDLLGESGSQLAVRISSALLDADGDPSAVLLLADLLDGHRSAVVRARVAMAREQSDAPRTVL